MGPIYVSLPLLHKSTTIEKPCIRIKNGHNPVLLQINGEKIGPIFVSSLLLYKSTTMEQP